MLIQGRSLKAKGPAKYIALEGIDGVGKTTQISLLKAWLCREKKSVYLTREPSDGSIGLLVRRLWNDKVSAPPHLYAVLFAADTLYNQHRSQGVIEQLRNRKYVLSDRSFLSTYAYLVNGCDLAWLDQLHRHCRRPDITVVIDLPPNVAVERLRQSRLRLGTSESPQELRRVRKNYLAMTKLFRKRGQQIEVLHVDRATKPVMIQGMLREIIR